MITIDSELRSPEYPMDAAHPTLKQMLECLAPAVAAAWLQLTLDIEALADENAAARSQNLASLRTKDSQ